MRILFAIISMFLGLSTVQAQENNFENILRMSCTFPRLPKIVLYVQNDYTFTERSPSENNPWQLTSMSVNGTRSIIRQYDNKGIVFNIPRVFSPIGTSTVEATFDNRQGECILLMNMEG